MGFFIHFIMQMFLFLSLVTSPLDRSIHISCTLHRSGNWGMGRKQKDMTCSG